VPKRPNTPYKDHCGRVAGSDFVFSNGLAWLAFPVPLGLSKADFAPFLKFDQPAWRHPISPEAPGGSRPRALHNPGLDNTKYGRIFNIILIRIIRNTWSSQV